MPDDDIEMTLCDRCCREFPDSDIVEDDGRCLCPDCAIVLGVEPDAEDEKESPNA